MAERWFLDACDPAGFVSGFDAYLTYCDGRCANRGGGPFGAQPVISSTATCTARVGDCEPLNPGPSAWVDRVPIVYCAWDGLSSFFDGYKESDVLAAADRAGAARPHLWVCRPGWNSLPFWRPEIIAVQTGLDVEGPNSYDVSITDDAGLAIITGGASMPLSPDDLNAIRGVLNEGAVFGTTSWAETNRNMAGGVQTLYNLLADVDNPTGKLATAIEASVTQALSQQGQLQVDAAAIRDAVLAGIKGQWAKP